MLPELNTFANSTSYYGGYSDIPRSCGTEDWAGGKANRLHLLSGAHIFAQFLMQHSKEKQTVVIACVVPFMFEEVDKMLLILLCNPVTCMCWIGFAELNDMLLEALLPQNSFQLVMRLTKES